MPEPEQRERFRTSVHAATRRADHWPTRGEVSGAERNGGVNRVSLLAVHVAERTAGRALRLCSYSAWRANHDQQKVCTLGIFRGLPQFPPFLLVPQSPKSSPARSTLPLERAADASCSSRVDYVHCHRMFGARDLSEAATSGKDSDIDPAAPDDPAAFAVCANS